MTDTETPQGGTCILFALPEERKPFLAGLRLAGATLLSESWKSLETSETPPDFRPCTLEFEGARVITGVSGVGMLKAAKMADTLLEAGGITAIIICGFAGALSPELQPGDLLLAGSVAPASTPYNRYFPDEDLYDAAETLIMDESGSSLKLRTLSGDLVTSNSVLTSPGEKRALFELTGGFAVDMETIGAVRVAQEHGIRWLAIRAITDAANKGLPLDFNAHMNSKGNISYAKVMKSVLKRPAKIPALIQLGKRSSQAAKNLSSFLTALLRRMPEAET